MQLTDFDYLLPLDRIAQFPTDKRENSKLMVLDRTTHEINHKHFYDVAEYLKPGDCLVMNDSRVIPARIHGHKERTGANVEFLLIRRIDGDVWETMVKPGKRIKPGDRIHFSDDPFLAAEILDFGEDGTRIARLEYDGLFWETLESVGSMPLPPYIQRETEDSDRIRYQTVYSKIEGSVAAPTAGLHFTETLLKQIVDKGVDLAFVTLHVGIGTFRPVKTEQIEDHSMHYEEYSVTKAAAETINRTKRNGGRVIAVGTTSVRTLESAVAIDGTLPPGDGSTGIFIYPGYDFKLVDGLITNFHLPKSTLLMLISAFYDREKVLDAYRTAVEEEYRFFSYGDAMMIL
ncbi:MAG: tRNA preQ1(34) S-adenosylmethionine ribosyltransferase-isomerase QueA [Firmicutes bacterium HGW-Firmicutes-11]|jgi:S-adenosylmethionine:tRNA ribosyltransferase-isomerase|nr:MAG: tRNA preQ1(34) S-adenosylmethionine ribosyltransferase-isomerase QueA [Firmicutes bacterium HGW-Firmicutes-11]